jgi:hypothetical protein
VSDWSKWTAAVFRGVSLGVDEWRLDAELVGVRIVGGLAIAGPGVLRSPVSFDATIRAEMIRAQAPAALADAVSAALWQTWKKWADGVTIPALPWYPAFFVWPLPVAPPTMNVPTPLALCVSTGFAEMTPERLGAAIRSRLGSGSSIAGSDKGVDDLAQAFHAAFMAWTGAAVVSMAFGTGTAAVGFPNVVGTVHGTLVNNGRGCLAAAVPFPDTPPPRTS